MENRFKIKIKGEIVHSCDKIEEVISKCKELKDSFNDLAVTDTLKGSELDKTKLKGHLK